VALPCKVAAFGLPGCDGTEEVAQFVGRQQPHRGGLVVHPGGSAHRLRVAGIDGTLHHN
jgi:hypothetical protein